MPRVIERDDIKARFRPIVPLLNQVIGVARAATAYDVTAAAHPEVNRPAHLRRFAGSKRWVMTADGLVERAAEFPDGFFVHSTDEDHNSGKYVFIFPGGIFTVRREPHQTDDEGQYLQLSLETVRRETPLASGIDAFADLLVYIGVPASGPARLVVTHTTLDKPIVILLDEITDDGLTDTVRPVGPKGPVVPSRGVRSTRVAREASEGSSADASDAP